MPFVEIDRNSLDSINDAFIYVYASIDPVTGVSWCPDCVKATPFIQKLAQNSTVFNCPAGLKQEWRSTDNFYKNSFLKTTRLPTLYKIVDGKIAQQWVESECYDEEKMNQLY